MPNVAYFPIAYYAILRLGAIVVPMNPLLKAGEISYAWNDAGAKVAVVFSLFAEEATKAAGVTGTDVLVVAPGEFEKALAAADPRHDVAVRDGSDTAVILYTSGTTGNPPRGVAHSIATAKVSQTQVSVAVLPEPTTTNWLVAPPMREDR